MTTCVRAGAISEEEQWQKGGKVGLEPCLGRCGVC